MRGYRSGPVAAVLALLYSVEVVALLWAAVAVGNLGPAHLGGGARLLALSLLAAAALVGWHAVRLLLGDSRLSVPGLGIQSAILIGAIALATQKPAIGVAGVVVAAGVLAGWGRLRGPARSATVPAAGPPSAAEVAAGMAAQPDKSGHRRHRLGAAHVGAGAGGIERARRHRDRAGRAGDHLHSAGTAVRAPAPPDIAARMAYRRGALPDQWGGTQSWSRRRGGRGRHRAARVCSGVLPHRDRGESQLGANHRGIGDHHGRRLRGSPCRT